MEEKALHTSRYKYLEKDMKVTESTKSKITR